MLALIVNEPRWFNIWSRIYTASYMGATSANDSNNCHI